jgi:hypothetical protein
MTTKPLEYPRDSTLLDPLKNLLEIRMEQNGKRKLTKLNGRHDDKRMQNLTKEVLHCSKKL